MEGIRVPAWLWTFIENLAANWTAELFGPQTVMAWLIAFALVVYGVIAWHRRQRAAKKPGMASWPVIILCCVVAIFAIAAACYTNPLST
jgi:glucan phosphoethanolaminetransferase (alkaline phosphatase superfamily)